MRLSNKPGKKVESESPTPQPTLARSLEGGLFPLVPKGSPSSSESFLPPMTAERQVTPVDLPPLLSPLLSEEGESIEDQNELVHRTVDRVMRLGTRSVQVFAKAAKEMGLALRYQSSGLSEAEYLLVSLPSSPGEDEVKIRFASHTSRPTYAALFGPADYEVAKNNGHAEVDGEVWDAIRWAARHFGKSVPEWVDPSRVEQRSASAIKAAQTRADAQQAREEQITMDILLDARRAGSRVPSGSVLVDRLGLSAAAARRIRAEVVQRLKVVSLEVVHQNLSTSDRPLGTPRSVWVEAMARPWVLKLTHKDGSQSDIRFLHELEARNASSLYGLQLPNLLDSRTTVNRPEFTPDNIQAMGPDEVFVFGSNLGGRHGKGAARTAMQRFGARYGQAEGLQGQSYAIPTVGRDIRSSLPVEIIRQHVDAFLAFAREHPELTFYVTEVGCGLAGHKVSDIAPMFKGASKLANIILPRRFIQRFQ